MIECGIKKAWLLNRHKFSYDPNYINKQKFPSQQIGYKQGG